MQRICYNGATLYVVGLYANTSCNSSGATAKPHLPELANHAGNRRTLAQMNYREPCGASAVPVMDFTNAVTLRTYHDPGRMHWPFSFVKASRPLYRR